MNPESTEGTGDVLRRVRDAEMQMKLATIYSAAVAALFLLPGLLIGPSFDAAVFTEVAARVRDGVLPYAGVWDHKPPGEYVLGALAQILVPWVSPWLPIWLLGVVFVAAAAAIVGGILVELGLRGAAVLGAMIAAGVPSVFIISLGGGLTEPMSVLPLAAALLVVLSEVEGERWWARSLLAGSLLGLALLLSLIAAAGIAAIGLVAMLVAHPETRIRRAALLVAGAAVPWIVVFVPLGLLGGLPAAFDALVSYGGAYRAVNLSHIREYAHAEAAVTVLTLLVVMVPAAVGVVRAFRLPDPWPALAVGAIGWVALTAFMVIYLGRFETHYAASLGIPLAIMAGLGAAEILRRARRSRLLGGVMIGATVLAAMLSLAVVAANSWAMVGPLQAETERTDQVAAFLRDHSPPNAALFVWGNEPQLYYNSGLTPATRFVYLLPLTTPGYVTADLIGEVRNALASAAPQLIVDVGSLEPGSPGDPPLLIPRHVTNEDGRGYDILDPLRRYVADNYELLEVVDGWPVYQKTAP